MKYQWIPRSFIGALMAALLLPLSLGANDLSAVLTVKAGTQAPVETSSTDPLDYSFSERLQVLGNLDLSPGLSLVGNGFYQFSQSGSQGKTAIETDHLYDINDLYLAWQVAEPFGAGSSFSLTLGRSFFYEFSTQVLAHKLDGVQLSVKSGDFSGRLALGTTAGLFKTGNAVLLTTVDLSALSDDGTFFAEPRLVAQGEFKTAEILPDQNLTVSVVGTLDISAERTKAGNAGTLDDGIPVSALWVGVGLDGKLATGVFYNLGGYLLTGTTLNSDASSAILLGWMGDASLSVFAPDLAQSRFVLGVNLSSGDTSADYNKALPEASTDDWNTSFFGLSKRGGGYIYSAQAGNVAVAKGSWSFKPLSGKPGSGELAATLDAQALFRLVNGPTAGALKTGTDQVYLGSEADLALNYRPLSDLAIALKGGIFVPNNQALDDPLSWKAGLDVSLSL